MGVKCKLTGHVYDATEFEEARQERPEGTVLICREYQVCRRCGDREELYRNERLVEPRGETSADAAGESATDRSTGTESAESEPTEPATAQENSPTDSTPEQDETTPIIDEQSPDTREGAEKADASELDPETVVMSDAEDIEAMASELDVTESETDIEETEEETVCIPDVTEEMVERLPASEETETADVTGTVANGQQGAVEDTEILEDTEPPSTDESSKPETATDGAEPTSTEPGESETQNSGAESATDDAVILSQSSAKSEQSATGKTAAPDRRQRDSTESTFEIDGGTETDAVIICLSCDGKWLRDETSLRDGDLCPACREGYVETSSATLR